MGKEEATTNEKPKYGLDVSCGIGYGNDGGLEHVTEPKASVDVTGRIGFFRPKLKASVGKEEQSYRVDFFGAECNINKKTSIGGSLFAEYVNSSKEVLSKGEIFADDATKQKCFGVYSDYGSVGIHGEVKHRINDNFELSGSVEAINFGYGKSKCIYAYKVIDDITTDAAGNVTHYNVKSQLPVVESPDKFGVKAGLGVKATPFKGKVGKNIGIEAGVQYNSCLRRQNPITGGAKLTYNFSL